MNLGIKLTIFCLILITIVSYGQDGQQLFRANCAACHNIDSRSTGPALQGARQRWLDNSSEEQFYKWIKNSEAVIAEGDPYAISVFEEFKKSKMTPQAVTDEEIDAIFEFVENPPPPEEKKAEGEDFHTYVVIPANYSGLFWMMVVVMAVLLMGILMVGNATQSLVKSKKFKEALQAKKKNDNQILKVILMMISLSLIPQDTFAFSFDMEAEYCVNVTMGDVYFLGILNLLLLCIFLYLKRTFNQLADIVVPRKKKVRQKKRKSLAKVLTARATVDEEESILMDHEYDGIQELDNNLPTWWKWGFYASIAFAFFYITYYHILAIGPSVHETYAIEMEEAQLAREFWLKEQAMNVDESNVTVLTDGGSMQEGKKVFMENCKVCHGDNGEGINGPNLTDDYWLYGNDIKSVFLSIKYGRKDGDMPPHFEKLNPVQMQQVASYVMQLGLVEGKAPEGEFMKDAPLDGEPETETASDATKDTSIIE